MISKTQELMFAQVPEKWLSTFNRIREIDGTLRCTDIRLISNPTDVQIDTFMGLLVEGKQLVDTVDMEEIEDMIGKNVLMENYIINFQEILRTQRVTAGYVWRKQLQKKKKELEDAAS